MINSVIRNLMGSFLFYSAFSGRMTGMGAAADREDLGGRALPGCARLVSPGTEAAGGDPGPSQPASLVLRRAAPDAVYLLGFEGVLQTRLSDGTNPAYRLGLLDHLEDGLGVAHGKEHLGVAVAAARRGAPRACGIGRLENSEMSSGCHLPPPSTSNG
jgi:hypothetical protein